MKPIVITNESFACLVFLKIIYFVLLYSCFWHSLEVLKRSVTTAQAKVSKGENRKKSLAVMARAQMDL